MTMLRSISGCISVLMVLGCTSDSLLWQRYTKEDFPAHVHSMMTRLGNFIDAEHTATYGVWTIGFEKSHPSASYRCAQDTICYIVISNLRCEHSSGASAPCDWKLYADASCTLSLSEKQEAFRFPCPYDVSFEPKKEDDNSKVKVASP